MNVNHSLPRFSSDLFSSQHVVPQANKSEGNRTSQHKWRHAHWSCAIYEDHVVMSNSQCDRCPTWLVRFTPGDQSSRNLWLQAYTCSLPTVVAFFCFSSCTEWKSECGKQNRKQRLPFDDVQPRIPLCLHLAAYTKRMTQREVPTNCQARIPAKTAYRNSNMHPHEKCISKLTCASVRGMHVKA